MSSERQGPAIRVEGIGKRYRIGAARPHYRTLREQLSHGLAAPLRRLRDGVRGARGGGASEELWALRDLSFQVEPGEVLGVVGHNGAGKSTLLRILSRITDPTEGEVRIRGRLASLLEVGTGFHPELTGRENVYLNGAILGMRKAEIDRRFEEIVEFAEVSRFVDTPVKHFSSGMYVRLAFAVAAHLEPEVLLVDEVLAVGDARFQSKSLSRMRGVARSGRTVVFVSHNLAAVRGLCTSCLFLEQGRVRAIGPVDEVLALYASAREEAVSLEWRRPGTAVQSTTPTLELLRVEGGEGGVLPVDQPCRIQLRFRVRRAGTVVIPGVHLWSAEGVLIFSSANWRMGELGPGVYQTTCHIPPFLLSRGRHGVSAFLFDSARPGTNELPADLVEGALEFEVDDAPWVGRTDRRWLRSWPGIVRPDLEWTTAPVAALEGAATGGRPGVSA